MLELFKYSKLINTEFQFCITYKFWKNLIPNFLCNVSRRHDHSGLDLEFSWLFIDYASISNHKKHYNPITGKTWKEADAGKIDNVMWDEMNGCYRGVKQYKSLKEYKKGNFNDCRNKIYDHESLAQKELEKFKVVDLKSYPQVTELSVKPFISYDTKSLFIIELNAKTITLGLLGLQIGIKSDITKEMDYYKEYIKSQTKGAK